VRRKYEGGRTSDEGHGYYRAKKRKLLEHRKCIFFLKNTFGVDLQVFLEMLLARPFALLGAVAPDPTSGQGTQASSNSSRIFIGYFVFG
jgi:hypothetical protein